MIASHTQKKSQSIIILLAFLFSPFFLLTEAKEPASPMIVEPTTELATLGGGCFWCLDALFQTVKGVHRVTSGYAGGTTPYPSYQQVTTGNSGHAEVVQIEFDPNLISYEELLDFFWRAHDPTTLNRQGNDRGTQYRSIILFHNDKQKETAEKSKQQADASGAWDSPIITEISSLGQFYPAESYHQDYFNKNPQAPYCQYVIQPKLEKLKEK